MKSIPLSAAILLIAIAFCLAARAETTGEVVAVQAVAKATKQKHVELSQDLPKSNVDKSYIFAYVEKKLDTHLDAQDWFQVKTVQDLADRVDAKLGVVRTDFQKKSRDVLTLAKANGFKPKTRVVKAIVKASIQYKIEPKELAAIAILETGLGSNVHTRKNDDGTYDRGIFQINTINAEKCHEFNLNSTEGSALCAAKLLSDIKRHRADYLGVYHSKTPDLKFEYLKKVGRVLLFQTEFKGRIVDYEMNSKRQKC